MANRAWRWRQAGIERIIVAEEMMKAGAPISASWIADRQMGPAIYSYGTQDQKERFLPAMLEGKVHGVSV